MSTNEGRVSRVRTSKRVNIVIVIIIIAVDEPWLTNQLTNILSQAF